MLQCKLLLLLCIFRELALHTLLLMLLSGLQLAMPLCGLLVLMVSWMTFPRAIATSACACAPSPVFGSESMNVALGESVPESQYGFPHGVRSLSRSFHQTCNSDYQLWSMQLRD